MSPLEAEIALLERELRGERARADRLQVKNKFLRERVGYMREDAEERWMRLIAERDSAFARGAEAMRNAASAHLAEYDTWGMMEPKDVKEEICSLPIPEEP